MRRDNKLFRSAALIRILALFLVSCSQEPLEELGRFRLLELDRSDVEINFCTLKPESLKGNLWFMVIFDKSTSNQQLLVDPGPPAQYTTGTDPLGRRRYVPYLTFLNNLPPLNGKPADQTLFFSAINFSNHTSTQTVFPLGSQQFLSPTGTRLPISNDLPTFENFIETDSLALNRLPGEQDGAPNDAGWTDYEQALQTAYNNIRTVVTDAKNRPDIQTWNIVIFYISDGAPIVNNAMQSTTNIMNAVRSIKAFENDRPWIGSVNFHTGYYFNGIDPDPAAETLMQQMASEGDGSFLMFNDGDEIDFTKFGVPIRNVRKGLADVFGTNINVTWQDGLLWPDTDADTLADATEQLLGSDPFDADSDNNGVRDGVEYSVSGTPCGDSRCRINGNRRGYAFCDPYLVDRNNPSNRVFLDHDNDGLNSCEEDFEVLNSDYGDFDTNGDWVPDELAFRRGLAFIKGVIDAWLNPDWDGVQNYDEVKLLTPLDYNNDKVIGLIEQKYNIEFEGTTPEGQDCYKVVYEDIPILSDTDTFRFYILEQTSIVDDQKFLRRAEKQLVPGQTVVFSDTDF